MPKLTVTVKQRTSKQGTGLEGSYQLPGSTSAKLQSKEGKTLFSNRGSLSQAAKRLGTSIGWEAELVEPQKKAAKKSVKAKKSASTKAKS